METSEIETRGADEHTTFEYLAYEDRCMILRNFYGVALAFQEPFTRTGLPMILGRLDKR